MNVHKHSYMFMEHNFSARATCFPEGFTLCPMMTSSAGNGRGKFRSVTHHLLAHVLEEVVCDWETQSR